MFRQKVICKACGSTNVPRTRTPGSLMIEIILWLCFLIPRLIYSFWRLSKKYKVCRACGSTDIVPVDSPVGRRLADEYDKAARS